MAKATTKAQPWKDAGLNKAEWVAREVAKAVNAGKAWDLETVDFSDPNRPPTCLEVDFPIIPINQIAAIEGNAGKPIYQMSKWWARRRSSVFRSMLLAAAIKAPEDPAEAAKLVWDVYYGNHQKKGTFKHLKVADIFMGGGTTVVEGSRLGMQMYGNDLNPVAWFVVKNELARVNKNKVEALLAEIEAEVKPQIMPFYACDCPRGHKGKWTQISTNLEMGSDFDPLALTNEQRKDYSYEGPELVYTFWAKHGPCQVTDCGHRTPIMSSPVIAVKSISVKAWKTLCKHCGESYDIEEHDPRMAPNVELVVADSETPFAVADSMAPSGPKSAVCPWCSQKESFGQLGKPKKKTVDLSLLIHPNWLRGEASKDKNGNPYGGSITDSVEATARWNQARAKKCNLVEVRGTLPDQIVLNDGTWIKTGKEGGTVPQKSSYSCGECGTVQDVLDTVRKSKKTGPGSIYAFQGYCPLCDEKSESYGGRFFVPANDSNMIARFDAAATEWESRKDGDLAKYWPRSELPFGFMTHKLNGGIPNHGYTHWWKMFNPRQLLVHSQILQKIMHSCSECNDISMFALGAFAQYLQCMTMFNHYEVGWDKMAVMFANNNFHPKSTLVENNFAAPVGRGNWISCSTNVIKGLDWATDPWELAHSGSLADRDPELGNAMMGLSEKVQCCDPLIHAESKTCDSFSEQISCGSSTELKAILDASYDAVITDPPFGGLLHYSELSDFFYVWLRLALKDKFPEYFSAEYTPKTMEAVANKARHPGDDPETGRSNADTFYQRLLTACWIEAKRILKPSGILSFTFHHSEDAPWVSVLESLFNAGFYLEATYPIRSDETKGDGQFGSKMIEYDIIHVCRQRYEEPKPISWPKLRRQVLQDVREIKELIEHHQAEGLPEADLQVIRRGKALEYFSRHYGKVYKDQETPMSVLEALLGINQLLDEEAGGVKEPPPHNAEPFTRMLLRLFDGKSELARDQIQKFLRGTGSAPSDFIERGWVTELKKVFYLVPPLEIAQSWIGKQRKGLTSDYDQAMFFIGACFENSGINASETLNNPNFLPHPALGGLLTWFKTHGADSLTRNAASTAASLYRSWETKNEPKLAQLSLFDFLGENE
jgi:putative DNA methylase